LLTSLTIKNYALIDHVQVDFNKGLTIITGETGAGKSVLLGGLSLVLGKRADLNSVKDSSKKCVIEAMFDLEHYNLKPLFETEGLDYEPQTIIRREILTSGKSRAFVNDTPVTLSSLQVLGEKVLDIHSQHQTLQLMDDEYQFQVIDALAKNNNILQLYKKHLIQFKDLSKKLQELKFQKIEADKALDYNLFLLNELEEAQLQEGELEMLEEEYETLNNVETIQDALQYAHQLLNNEELGILTNLRTLKQNMSKLSEVSSQYQSIFERINSSLIELDDIAAEVGQLQGLIEADPNRLEVVNNKLQLLHNLMQKHTASSVEELIEIRDALKNNVATTENLDEEIQNTENKLVEQEQKLKQLAQELHLNRTKAIPKLIKQLESILAKLGMPNAKFEIHLESTNKLLDNGSDLLKLLFTANKGGKLNDLKKSASGGELSRIMLAIKAILADYAHLPTIIFDEIDTGVSGEISNKMALIMKQMSKSMQVFTITHLPQIAAKGDTHYKVFKKDIDGVTKTLLKQLNEDERIVEIAQMLDGTKLSDSALQHAKQLLN